MRPAPPPPVGYVEVVVLGKLFLLFTVVPVLELYLLIHLGGLLGPGITVGIVLTTGLLGASLARREGSRVFRDWQAAIGRGEMPKEGLVSSLLVLVGGVLLVTPGVLTDAFGIAMLIPPARRVVARMLQSYVQKRFAIEAGPAGFIQAAGTAGWPGRDDADSTGDVIDVDAHEAPTESKA